jgi:hypothetical protein
MAGKISMGARREVLSAVAERYGSAGRTEKGRILDELCAVSGWHRKHAIRALSTAAAKKPPTSTVRARVYGAAVADALAALWEASDRVCGKRLKVMIPALLPALERHGRLQLEAADRAKVLTVSAATIDRILSATRAAAAGGKRRRAGYSSAIRREVPIRTFNDWKAPPPGFCEVDMVAHGGTSVAGSFIQTLTMVDIATGWTECLPLVTREGALVVDAIERSQSLFPWLLRGLDFDNDSAFMNDVVVPWCRAREIEVTRSRAYKKNDQAHVEQKNGAVVRRLVGYGRFEGIETARLLARLYAAARLHVNFFQPSFKLKEKRREGAKIIKRYHGPQTPCDRALAHDGIDEMIKQRLREIRAGLDPIALLAEMRAAQAELGHRVDRRQLRSDATERHNGEHRTGPVSVFAQGLGRDYADGEQRVIHRRPYVRKKPPPRRPSMLDPYATKIDAWLTAEPHLSGAELLRRLNELAGASFTSAQLRTVQRLCKAWRRQAARQLIDAAEMKLAPDTTVVRSPANNPPSVPPALGNIVT